MSLILCPARHNHVVVLVWVVRSFSSSLVFRPVSSLGLAALVWGRLPAPSSNLGTVQCPCSAPHPVATLRPASITAISVPSTQRSIIPTVVPPFNPRFGQAVGSRTRHLTSTRNIKHPQENFTSFIHSTSRGFHHPGLPSHYLPIPDHPLPGPNLRPSSLPLNISVHRSVSASMHPYPWGLPRHTPKKRHTPHLPLPYIQYIHQFKLSNGHTVRPSFP